MRKYLVTFLLLVAICGISIALSLRAYEYTTVLGADRNTYNFWLAALVFRSLLIFATIIYLYKKEVMHWLPRFILSGLLVIEVFFTFFPNNMGGPSFARINWTAYYYRNVNSYGFWDTEPDTAKGKIRIACVGDSYTAGIGLRDYNDRYDKILSRVLPGKKFAVYNIGRAGSDNVEELQTLKEYPVKPDIVVLQYFNNDIDGTFIRSGNKDELPVKEEEILGHLKNPLVSASFIGNYIFWSNPKFWIDQEMSEKFRAHFDSNLDVVKLHQKELEAFADYCHNNRLRLIVFLMPELTDLEQSRGFYDKYIQPVFESKRVKVIRIEEEVEKLPVQERVATSADPHGSPKVHKIIAEKLFIAITDTVSVLK